MDISALDPKARLCRDVRSLISARMLTEKTGNALLVCIEASETPAEWAATCAAFVKAVHESVDIGFSLGLSARRDSEG